MKLVSALATLCLAQSAMAFTSSSPAFVRQTTQVSSSGNGMDLSGNSWKPDSEKMGSTDTGDFFPDDYQNDLSFEDGMMGSQAGGSGNRDGPSLPGMEGLGDDAIMMGGIEQATDIPAGMEFVPSSVPDGEFVMTVAGSSSGSGLDIEVKPVCMTFEDYFAGFSADSHPSFSVSPATGRMDRRGGEVSKMTIFCDPGGKSGTFEANLVINLPEDNSKICYKIMASVF